MRRLLLLFPLVFVPMLRAEDAQLSKIRAILVPLRGKFLEQPGDRGGSETLTTAKHLLREWIESRLPQDDRFDVKKLSDALSAEIVAAKMTGNDDSPDTNWSQLGFLGDIKITRWDNLLIVTTGIGIECGNDESVYVYRREGKKWHLAIVSEQNDYRKDHYFPQQITKVLVGPPETYEHRETSPRLVLTLGYQPWCSSTWHDVYYRAWKLKPPFTLAKPLVDRKGVGLATMGC